MRQNEFHVYHRQVISSSTHPKSEGGNHGVRNTLVPSISGKGYSACISFYMDVLFCVAVTGLRKPQKIRA